MASKPYFWLAFIGVIVLSGCSQPVRVYEGAPSANDKLAMVSGGGLPNLRSVDQRSIEPNLMAGKPDIIMAAGAHTLVIDYQPCSKSNSCGLTSATADVVLEPGRTYEIRHLKDGCTLWVALTSFTRKQETPCRNYLWIEDQATGDTIWGTVPADLKT